MVVHDCDEMYAPPSCKVNFVSSLSLSSNSHEAASIIPDPNRYVIEDEPSFTPPNSPPTSVTTLYKPTRYLSPSHENDTQNWQHESKLSQELSGLHDSDSESEGDEKIYNPLKLPLAWDGKPIPYWLYKLHGLGVELPCEICGNFVYMGRRAFDKHFSEARHIYGLRCLGITQQTSLFREITRIEDALRLWEKLERDRKKERESRDNVVQMEDAEGNVMPERIYLEYVSSFRFDSIRN